MMTPKEFEEFKRAEQTVQDEQRRRVHEDTQVELDRIVARWIIAGKPGVETPELQAWLTAHGYGHYITTP